MSTDPSSAYSCGCDPGAKHHCETHRARSNAQPGFVPARDMGSLLQQEKIPITIPAPARATTLPTSASDRKQYPVASGVLDYFPDALAAVAYVSFKGNEQHNPGQPLHWAREKSTDEADTLIRHFLQRGSLDTDGLRHTAKMAWRALALLQKELEQEGR